MALHPATFDYLAATEQQRKTMEAARAAAKTCADALDELLPDGPDKIYTLRKLREVGMWANVAITRHPNGKPREG